MISTRRFLLALALIGSVPFGEAARAASREAFTAESFRAAQRADRPILVEVTAPWCPTCKAQKPILAELAAQPRFQDLVIFEVDFDSQKDVLRMLNAQMQSTLIVFRGAEEVSRSTGETDPGSIAAQLESAI